ncbi:conserved hypothetical protein [Bifidobacterium bifidum ATCC 29521 = JCM 1255 = DSM 20456]|uniref:Uncharacterized protein n=1 Tax=Bifidobacterium bifidum ATCC 29521 = JCM 1255 = DSM 20456 TaxID=500634 RepID=A0ABM7EPF7_BIFBI|nr:conserved hypothetical protein [Bifidobacterium bifidum ATCC 29521 = JCM 1255 = DSM 20456]
MIATFAVLIAFFVVDLFVIGRKPHVPSTKECVQHIAFFVVMALIFGGLVWCFAGSKPAIEFYSRWLTEYSLSIDNLFVFVIIMSNFAVPKVLQKYVLSVGITRRADSARLLHPGRRGHYSAVHVGVLPVRRLPDLYGDQAGRRRR